ncbi:MAG: DUF4276 family protein [Planctomycetaceae bacterium]|jgi:hypothetical protein|nr:DUF4276 family protein [Planctomycetaceae bacterium]
MKRLVLMVEGEGDVKPALNITSKVLRRLFPDSAEPFFIDSAVIKVGDVNALLSPKDDDDKIKLIRLLKAVEKRADLGGVLLLLDGDTTKPVLTAAGRQNFCPVTTGRYLVDLAIKKTCAGQNYSFAVVFAKQEFESWILAGNPSFAEQTVNEDLEKHPRNAKKKIEEITKQPYSEVIDQIKYAKDIDIESLLIRQPPMRSFRRFKLFALEFAFTFACLAFGRQALTLLNH